MLKKAMTGLTLLMCLSVNAQSLDLSLGTNDWSSVSGQTLTGAQTFQAGPNAWSISPYTGSTMYSLSPTNTTNTYSNMSTALGLSSVSVTALSAEIAAQNPSGGGSITNAAWVSKNFTFAAPSTFKMYWTYTSVDYVPFNDGSITTLVNTDDATTLGKINGVSTQYLLLGATNPGTGNYSTGSYGSTGWQVVNYNVLTAGTYKLGFAVFNQGDTALSPVLNVNDGLGTVTQNGTIFGSVAPNDPSMPTVDPTPPAATVVSQSTSDSTTSSSVNGTSTIVNNIAYGVTAVAVAQSNGRGEQTPKVLKVIQTTVTTEKTPFTLTQTSTTPVTTTTVTTPVTTKVWSDGTTTIENGTPVTSTTTSNSVSSVDTPGIEVVEIDTKKDYSTRVDQYSYLNDANHRINLTLDSDTLSRHQVSDNILKPKTDLIGDEEKGWTYFIAEGQRSNTSDTYKFNTQRYGVGHEKNIESNWIVGGQYNHVNSNLTGDQSGGNLEKNHVGVYSLYSHEGWLLKSDFGVAVNTYRNYHTINELQLGNQGKANGKDVWLANRVYAPSLEGIEGLESFEGFRPYAGVRVQNTQRNGLTESGSEVSSMTYDKINKTNTIGEAGVRYENVVFEKVNVIAEAGRTTNNITTIKVGANFTPKENVLGNASLTQQRQNGVTNNIAQVSLKVLF